MTVPAFWTEPDYDDHELVELVHDRESGLTAIIAVHSTHLGPAGGGTRFWHYADPAGAMRDALRLSRGMSYKNAMAGLPMGGGKAVILADPSRTKTPEVLAAFGKAIDGLGGRYVTAEDVGMTEADMVAISQQTPHVSGLPSQDAAAAGGDPGPFTARGVALGIKAAVAHKLGCDSVEGVHVAVQGAGSVGGGVARILAGEGARVTLADVDAAKAQALAEEIGAEAVSAEAILGLECDVLSPNALGAILNDETIPALQAKIIAGAANNQLARPEHGRMLAERGILFAPDYVISGGGIIAVALEYFARQSGEPCGIEAVQAKIDGIPDRLLAVWQEAEATGKPSSDVADAMAQAM
ncbi:MAG: Glu/Leu/Phe/Val dehydrogenase dimerization domain-containing protein, partial [Sphingomonadaceae bacterium]